MFKKIILVSAIYASFANYGFAGTPYLGGSIGWNAQPTPGGPIGTVFGGYGTRLEQIKRLYIGGELGLSGGYYTQYNFTYRATASFIPGVMITDNTMIYGRVGIATGFTNYIVNNNNEKRFVSTNSNAVYGLGIQTKLSDKWDLRGEYTSTTNYKTGVYSVGLLYKFN